jgi:hypothetical protein
MIGKRGEENNGNNQPNDGADCRACNNQPDGAAWRHGTPWSTAAAAAHGHFKDAELPLFEWTQVDFMSRWMDPCMESSSIVLRRMESYMVEYRETRAVEVGSNF